MFVTALTSQLPAPGMAASSAAPSNILSTEVTKGQNRCSSSGAGGSVSCELEGRAEEIQVVLIQVLVLQV
eukprot:g5576.t1